MIDKLPNLELIMYKAQHLLTQDENFVKRLAEHKPCRVDFVAETFPQMWANTCAGFDITPDGQPTVGGSAMTEVYTTVIKERVTNTYIVFFGDKACYKVDNPPETFLTDLNKRQMRSLSQAKELY